MYVVEIFLPLEDNEGTPFPSSHFQDEARYLTGRFGGLTAFTRSPAEGIWDTGRETVSDRIVIFEVMTDQIDTGWWSQHRKALEETFRQDKVLIRATAIQAL